MVAACEEEWMASRFQSMSLQSLPNTKKEKLKQLSFGRVTNYVDDIQGATHKLSAAEHQRRRDFYQVDDIDGSSPLTLHKALTRKPDRQLYVGDIEGAKPRPKTFRTARVVDPLDPKYRLPTVIVLSPPEPKFVRDAMDINDIEGTHSQPLYSYQQRDHITCSDILGAAADWKPRHARARREAPPSDIMNVRDINTDGIFKTRRSTDPLDPAYKVNGMHICNPPDSKPKRLPRRKNAPFFPLVTEDIEGTQPGWVAPTDIRPLPEDRRQWHNTNFVGDIVGAHADSVVHSIRTERHTNPLNPIYIALDGSILQNPVTPRYRDPAAIEAELVAKAAMERAAAQKAHTRAVEKDSRDALISQLQSEVDRLRGAVKGSPATSSPPAREPVQSALAATSAPATECNAAVPRDFVAPRLALPCTSTTSSGGREQAKGQACGDTHSAPQCRPVPLTYTPEEAQAAKVTQQDIDIVRQLS